MFARIRAAVDQCVTEGRETAQYLTYQGLVAFEAGICTDPSLADQIAVIGDDREIEGAPQLDVIQRSSLWVVGLDADPFSLRKSLGSIGPAEGVPSPRSISREDLEQAA